ncbi:MAG: ATP-binding protein [Thermoplasmata archaeon]
MPQDSLDRTLELTTSIMSMRDVDTLLRKVADSVTDDFGFEGCDVFLINEEKDAYILRVTEGFPRPMTEKLEGFALSARTVEGYLSVAERLGRFTYLYKAKPGESENNYYSIMHPERVRLPRVHEDDWHELDVLYVTFEDSAGNIIGFIEPDSPRSGKLPTGSLVTNLEIFATLTSIAITNAKLMETLDKTAKLYKAMLETVAALQEPVDLKMTLQRISEKLNELVPFDELSVYLADWDKNLLVPLYATGPYADEVMADVGPPAGLAGEVAKSGKVEIVEDSSNDPRVEDISGLEDIEISQTIMAVPLKGRRGVEGVLELYRDKGRKFTETEYAVVEPFAAHAAVAIENARLREELKANFESVQKAYEEMKDLDHMKDSLVDTISHELRTPLTTVMGYLEMASVGLYGDVTPKMKEKFETMLESVRRINQLVAAMLEMSRLDEKTLALDLEPINIAMVTKEVLHDLDNDIQERNHKVAVLFGSDLPVVVADRLRIYDVIQNLVSNAVKYTHPGGSIAIGADILGGKMHMWVRDNGIGIAEVDRDKIFDRFFLAEAGLTRADNRVGIGLHISREIVRKHGGEMWFESKKGQGSTFHFAIPLSPGKAKQPHRTT